MAIERETPKYETVMDFTEEQVARVYAKAFLGVASKSKNADGLVDEVASLVDDVLNRFPKFEQTLRSGLVGHEQKSATLDRVFGQQASTEVLNFLKVISSHGRLGLLRPIVRAVKKLFTEQRGQTEVEIRVASELDDSLRNELIAKLRAKLGAEPVLHVIIDPSLIAGIVVRTGDRVYDGSVRTQFEIVRKAMIERATEFIESNPDRFVTAS